jgi:hypothetical protein
MGLNLSNHQIAQVLDLNKDDIQQMTWQLRQGIVAKRPTPPLSDAVECDEAYIVAGHKGKPDEVTKKGVAAGVGGSGASAAEEHLPLGGRRSSGGSSVVEMW